jgi:cation diffusion facilitator CzcD-associated flavoprotein CzcO
MITSSSITCFGFAPGSRWWPASTSSSRPVTYASSETIHPLGAKRLCVDSGYYETYNRDNVTLIDVKRCPVESFSPTGVRTRTADYALDMIVLALGFDAMTGALLQMDIRGEPGVSLKDHWADGTRTMLGICVAGFPNLFTITGPGSPSLLCNTIVAIEQHVDWIADCIQYMQAHGYDRIEATPEAEAKWTRHVREVADDTLFPLAESYYVGGNVSGKPRVFILYAGGLDAYTRWCQEVTAAGYDGFRLGRTGGT